ncbi:hypothetical protein GGF50DRAFT_47306 [Schizophyllum commune]
MPTPQHTSYDFTLHSRGKEAQMKLIGLSIQSLLFGTYLTLALAMFYLLRCRCAGSKRERPIRHPANVPLLVGLCFLTTALTGHWITVVIRSFQAFIYWHGGQQVSIYYVELAGSIGIARFAFHGANGIIADAFVIARLYIIWDYNKLIVVFPLLCLAGFFVAAIGTTYAYGVFNPSVPETLASLHHWRLARTVPSLCINFYCTAIVVWRLARIRRQTMDRGISESIGSVLIILVESAAFFTAVVLISQVMYEADNVTTYFFTDCVPYIAALTAILVHARAVIANAPGVRTIGRRTRNSSPDLRHPGVWRNGTGNIEESGDGDAECYEGRPSPLMLRVESAIKSSLEISGVTPMPRAVTRG